MTIIDIANEAGYSVSTVSRVLNGRRDVSEEARQKIMEVVQANHFVPNHNAKCLKQTVSKSILIIVKGTSNMLFSNVIEAPWHCPSYVMSSTGRVKENKSSVNCALSMSKYAVIEPQ